MNERNISDLAGVWLCREQELRILAAGQPMQAGGVGGIGGADDIRTGVAFVYLHGMLSKSPAWWSNGTSTMAIRRTLRRAVDSPAASAILIHADSPGGTAAGTAELADDIAMAARVKPTWAYIQDQATSAAYWAVSQATRVFANRTAITGSIGTYGVVVDTSAMAQKLGIKVHVVRAGAMKGMGVPGTEVSAEQLAEYQRIINELNSHFLAGVGAGRRMSKQQVAAVADGRSFMAADAVKAGLIDGIATLDTVFNQLAQGQLGTSPTAAAKPKGPKMDAIQQWEDAIAQKMERNPSMTKAQATRAVVSEQPELHQAYLAAYNEKHRDAVRR